MISAKRSSYVPELLPNGDFHKQLLSRSRYFSTKPPPNGQKSRHNGQKILFKEYPDIYQAHSLVNNLSIIFNETTDKGIAFTRLAHRYKEVEESGIKAFNTVANGIQLNYRSILNYFKKYIFYRFHTLKILSY